MRGLRFSMLGRPRGGRASGMGMSPPQDRQWAAGARSRTEASAPGIDLPEREPNRVNPSWAQGDGATRQVKEDRKMSDCHCCDNDHGLVKLVQYTIVSIKRCDERILKEGKVIES